MKNDMYMANKKYDLTVFPNVYQYSVQPYTTFLRCYTAKFGVIEQTDQSVLVAGPICIMGQHWSLCWQLKCFQ